MHSGPATRTRKNHKNYRRYVRHVAACDFCAFQAGEFPVREEHEYFWVVENMFGYDIWDSMGVSEHLMVVPKRHAESIGEFTASEAKEYLSLIAHFESSSYSLYSRAKENAAKSVPHQHTHLIKLNNKRKKLVVFIHRPHWLWHL